MASAPLDIIVRARDARRASKDVDGVTGSVTDLGEASSRSARKASAADRAHRGFHSSLKAVATAAKVGVVGVGLLGGAAVKMGVSSVRAAMGFEEQMSSLGSVTGAGVAQMARHRAAALQAGAATKYSASQAVTAQTELAKGGISTANILNGGLKAALALAAAGELDLADAASYTANAMNLFGLSGGKTTHVADALATAANATTADVKDFGMALAAGGSVAKSAGLSFDQTVVALEALAASGIKNSDAGTSLKAALTQLINPTDKQAELAKQLGVNFIDASGNMKSLASISGMLRGKLGGLTATQRTAALATLAGTDGVRTLTSLYDAGPKGINAFSKGLGKQGSAAEVAAKKQDNLKGKIEGLKGSFETLQIVIGTALLPVLTKGAEKATGLVNSATKGAQRLQAAYDASGAQGLLFALDDMTGANGKLIATFDQVKAQLDGIDFNHLGTEAKNAGRQVLDALSGVNVCDVGGSLESALGPLKTFADIAQWAFELPGAKTALVSIIALGASFKVLNAASGGAAGGMLAFTGGSFRLGLATAALITQVLAYKTARIGVTATENVGTAATTRASLATRLFTGSLNLLKVAAVTTWAAITGPIGLVILGLTALGVGFVMAYKHVGFFRDGVLTLDFRANRLTAEWKPARSK